MCTLQSVHFATCALCNIHTLQYVHFAHYDVHSAICIEPARQISKMDQLNGPACQNDQFSLFEALVSSHIRTLSQLPSPTKNLFYTKLKKIHKAQRYPAPCCFKHKMNLIKLKLKVKMLQLIATFHNFISCSIKAKNSLKVRDRNHTDY